MAIPVESEGRLLDHAVAIWKRFEYLNKGKSPKVLGQLEYSDGLVVKAAGFKVVRDHARALRKEDKASIRGAIATPAGVIAGASAAAADAEVVPDAEGQVPAVAMSSPRGNDAEGRKRKKRRERK
jgi:hypothetical protein